MKTYKGVEISLDGIRPGSYYLILVKPELGRGDDYYELCQEPGRTNQNHQVRLHGWLGTTNNVARFGEGCIEVYQNKVGRYRLRACPDIEPEDVGAED